METLYLTLFLLGTVYAVVTVIFGDIFQIDVATGDLPFLSPTTIASFVTVFGGVGYFLSVNTGMNPVIITAISIIGAVMLASLMFFLVVLPLSRAEKSAAASSKGMIGHTAEVITSIESGRIGEIIYDQGGSRLSAPAKLASDSTAVSQGEIVTIIDEISGTFIVEKQA